VLLDGNRLAVVGALLTFVFVALMLAGTLWTFEMQQILTETSTVENVLETFLSGIILLVSIVVSINSIVLSRDISSIETQEARIRSRVDFRAALGELDGSVESPRDPTTFLDLMTHVITERTDALETAAAQDAGGADEDVRAYAEAVADAIEGIEDADRTHADFGVLWTALDFDYGPLMDRSRALRNPGGDGGVSESLEGPLDRLVEAYQLFAIGKEYFKTLYYTREVSRLSRTLLVVSLPVILVTASAILAISAGVLPEVWVLGLPPLLSFVATMFTIALIPYVVLTSFILRLSTVAMRSASGGLFSVH
jgi:hypothetical protein